MDIIETLQEKDNASAYKFFLELELRSAESDAFYSCFEDFLGLLHHSKSFVRVRGFRLCCAQAPWDCKDKIGSNLAELLTELDDDKPTAVRQCLASLHALLRCKPELSLRIEQKINSLDSAKYKDSMRPLLEQDIQKLRELMRAVSQ